MTTLALILCMLVAARNGVTAECNAWVSDPDNCKIETSLKLDISEYVRFSSGAFGITDENLHFCEVLAEDGAVAVCHDVYFCGGHWGCSVGLTITPAVVALYSGNNLSGGNSDFALVTAKPFPGGGPAFTGISFKVKAPSEVCMGGKYKIHVQAMQGRVKREINKTEVFVQGNNTETPNYTLPGPPGGANRVILPPIEGTARLVVYAAGCGCKNDKKTISITVAGTCSKGDPPKPGSDDEGNCQVPEPVTLD